MRSAAAALALFLPGCGEERPVRLDGRSQAAFERRADKARQQLPVADRLTFDSAIRTIGGRRFANNDPQALARLTFDNMTAADIVADQQQREQ